MGRTISYSNDKALLTFCYFGFFVVCMFFLLGGGKGVLYIDRSDEKEIHCSKDNFCETIAEDFNEVE